MSVSNPEILSRLNAARTPRGKKEPTPIAKESAKMKEKKKEEKKAGGNVSKLELDKWFFDIEEKYFSSGIGVCMETGDEIPRVYARHATAHLLAKKNFPSVATHPLNYLILSAHNGSHDKTHRVDTFIKMKIWPEAAARLKVLIALLPVDELRQISNQLLVAIDSVT